MPPHVFTSTPSSRAATRREPRIVHAVIVEDEAATNAGRAVPAVLSEDAVEAFARWRRGGTKVGLVSSRAFTDAAARDLAIDAIVHAGAPDRWLDVARVLGVSPSETIVLGARGASVTAARSAGFAWVVGVERGPNGRTLREAGADEVVSSPRLLRFVRHVASALQRRDEIAAWCGDRRLAVFLDYDGTLTPIVNRPEHALLSVEMRAIVQRLLACGPIAIVSGRDRKDVEARVGLAGVAYAGSHGFDIAGPGIQKTLPEAAAVVEDLASARRVLERRLAGIAGLVLEHKAFSLAIHYRMVAPADVRRVADAVSWAAGRFSLRERSGKKVRELLPAVDWDKGKAVRWIASAIALDEDGGRVLYLGDDETDEDAFRVLGPQGLGVRVGAEPCATFADYCLRGEHDVREFLAWLVQLRSPEPGRYGRPLGYLGPLDDGPDARKRSDAPSFPCASGQRK